MNCYLLNCVKLALLFAALCKSGVTINVEVRDELLVGGACTDPWARVTNRPIMR